MNPYYKQKKGREASRSPNETYKRYEGLTDKIGGYSHSRRSIRNLQAQYVLKVRWEQP